MACTIGPCPTCDGTGRATSEFWRRRESVIGEHHFDYIDDSHRYTMAGLLFVDGKCLQCGGAGLAIRSTSMTVEQWIYRHRLPSA